MEVYEHARQAVEYLKSRQLQIVVENKMLSYLNMTSSEVKDSKLEILDADDKSIDFIILFGGDGLLLYCSTLFQNKSMPPIIFFDFGSFGFLSPFYYNDFSAEVLLFIAVL